MITIKQSRRTFFRWMFGLVQANLFLGWLRPSRLNAAGAAPFSPDGALSFLVFGDWGREGQHHQTDVGKQMGIAAANRKCPFIISVGDNFYESGVASATDRQWQTSFENIYTAPSLAVPWYVILGNHDYRGEPEAQLEYAKTHPNWKMPGRYFTAIEPLPASGNVEFFFIDTSPFLQKYKEEGEYQAQVSKQDSKVQLAWLDKALGASQATWKIVIGHHPIFSGGEHGDTAELIRDVNPLLKKHGVFVYMNGHDHDLQHIVRDGIHYFDSGAGSKIREVTAVEGTVFDRGVPGFMAVDLTKEKMAVEFIDYQGVSLYQTEVLNRSNADTAFSG
jgi:tartrate-resistant acid phosphatase type 5